MRSRTPDTVAVECLMCHSELSVGIVNQISDAIFKWTAKNVQKL